MTHEDRFQANQDWHFEELNEINKDLPIGTTFKTRGKHPRICTVTDILKTYNSAGELIRTAYVATHDFMGQTITETDICRTTIKRGMNI